MGILCSTKVQETITFLEPIRSESSRNISKFTTPKLWTQFVALVNLDMLAINIIHKFYSCLEKHPIYLF